MKAAILHAVRDMRIEERPEPTPAGTQVVVRVRCIGVCGSDVHYYATMRIGDQIVEKPQPVGHEFAGEVTAVGDAVTEVEVGQRVAIEPGRPCHKCRQCHEGRPNCCPNVIFYGTPPVEGAMQEYVLADQEQCIPIPDSMGFDEAAMLEPLQVGVHAYNLVPAKPGEWVAISGSGSIGLACLAMARAAGATRIVMTDKLDYRLDLARKLGATHTVNVTRDDPEAAVKAATDGMGADVVYEATNSVDGLAQAVRLAAIAGRVAAIGIPPEDEIPLPTHFPRRKQLTIQYVRRAAHTIRQALELVSSGRIDVKPWVTHRFSLDQASEAYEVVDGYSDGILKAVIEM